MSDETIDETGGAAKAAPTEQVVHSSASSLTIGLCLILGGGVIFFLARLFVVGPTGGGSMILMFLGGTAIVFGVVQLVIGVYQLADNVDRTAKAVLNGQRR
ncbi:hypothetical protein ACFWEJ_00705 [Promicromonospora sp. NPDC060204]|uniref:hypothetical protein n=1 Tax=Promicromonospora sp. NPDC060204 TaxID=3347071 RepID=UPI0036497E5F